MVPAKALLPCRQRRGQPTIGNPILNKPIIPWIGGKRRLAKKILPLFREHTCYVEPFAGAAAIFFAKEPSKVEVINDVNGELVNLYRVVQNHLEEFVRQFKYWLVSREAFNRLQDTKPELLTDIQRAARFYYLQKMSFAGKVSGQTFGTATVSPPRFNLLRIEEDLSQAHLRLARVLIENLHWQRLCEKYDRPHSLFYLDPPYWETEGYGVDFPWQEYERIAAFAATAKGQVVISINDHPEIRHLFAAFNFIEVDIEYSIAKAGSRKKSRELIFTK